MDISVVIPVYNSKGTLSDCIRSILDQDFKGTFEMILVDDCSTDGTYEMIKELTAGATIPVKVLRTPVNSGYPTAMNSGIAASQGKYIARQDSDDVSHPSRLSMLFQAIESNPDVCMVTSIRFWLTPNGIPYHEKAAAMDAFFLESWEDILELRRRFTDPATMFPREYFEKAGGYNTYQRSGMDVDLWLRIIELTGKPVLTLNKTLYGRRLMPNSLIYKANTTHNNKLPRIFARFRVSNGLPPDFPPDAEWMKRMRKESPPAPGEFRRVRLIMDTALVTYGMGDFKGFLSFFKMALSRNPMSTLRILASAVIKPRPSKMKAGIPEIIPGG
jgi:glycosyltransferase involved in cell wall biosynthesis